MFGFLYFLFLFLQLQRSFHSIPVYESILSKKTYSSHYSWVEVQVSIIDVFKHKVLLSQQAVLPPLDSKQYKVSDMTNTKVFVSLTTISSRVRTVNNSIMSILHENLLTIVYTENLGPHCKLLPLLSRYYDKQDNVAIVTIDDDLPYISGSLLLYKLVVEDIKCRGTAVVAMRIRRVGICEQQTTIERGVGGVQNNISGGTNLQPNSFHISNYSDWSLVNTYGRSEMLVLPTATGGVLYRPSHFHSIVFDEKLRKLTSSTDDLMFRLACMANNVSVVSACKGNRRRCKVDVQQFVSSPRTLSGKLERGHDERRRYLIDKTSLPRNTTGENIKIELKQAQDQLAPSLWTINQLGRNDRQWRDAVEYLEQMQVIPSFSDLIRRHYWEREASCYSGERNKKSRSKCSLYICTV